MPRRKIRTPLLIMISLILLFFWNSSKEKTNENHRVNIIDPDSPALDRDFPCVKTKPLLNLPQTTLCVYASADTISDRIKISYVWEEHELIFLLKILKSQPEMIMIDIGANLGGYSMYTAGSLKRLTIAIDCYLPNIERIAKAVRLEKLQNQTILIHNALYSKSGEELKIPNHEPSGIRLNPDTNETIQSNNFFLAKTIEFDDLLPILRKHQVKMALIKIDIETSEIYMCQTGEKIFNEIDIPFIMMEWSGWRIKDPKRYEFIVNFFLKRNYFAINDKFEQLNITRWLKDWPGNIYWIKANWMFLKDV